MDTASIYRAIPGALLPWYGENRRDLPWRSDREPYHIWISEIMLQQTRVEAVRGYYQHFLTALPTVESLALCDDEKLHKLWEGLGYYSRVRNLKKAAGVILSDFGGVFPRRYEDVLSLPGIGEYTAGAICSIAFSQPVCAVDGNVLRLTSRLTADATPIDLPAQKRKVQQALTEIYTPENAPELTQALMELGATVCLPNGAPKCEICPCRAFCKAVQAGNPTAYPVKLPKKKRREADMTVFLLQCGDRIALEKRPDQGLLALMWQFPNVPGKLEAEAAIRWAENEGLHPRQIRRIVERSHIFTHIQWNMRGVLLEVSEEGRFTWMTPAQLDAEAPIPTAFRQFREEFDR